MSDQRYIHRIEVNEIDKWDGCRHQLGHTMIAVGISAPNYHDFIDPNAKFWFTDKGWILVRDALLTECRLHLFTYRTLSILWPPSPRQIVYEDEFQLAILPLCLAMRHSQTGRQ